MKFVPPSFFLQETSEAMRNVRFIEVKWGKTRQFDKWFARNTTNQAASQLAIEIHMRTHRAAQEYMRNPEDNVKYYKYEKSGGEGDVDGGWDRFAEDDSEDEENEERELGPVEVTEPSTKEFFVGEHREI